MRKTLLLGVVGLQLAYAQQGRVGINTSTPVATLEVNATSNETAKGILIPRVTGEELKTMTANLGADQNSMLVYVTAAVADNTTQGFENIIYPGYYRFKYDVNYGIVSKTWVRVEPSGLEKVKNGSNTGWRLVGDNNKYYTRPIGDKAVDLTINNDYNPDRGAIGLSSFAVGSAATASGVSAIAMGMRTVASGAASVAIGFNATAKSPNAFAIGNGANVGEPSSGAIAIGEQATVGNYASSSIAIGSEAKAQANYATAIGRKVIANGAFSTAMGYQTYTELEGSFAAGKSSRATGATSVAIGYENNASDTYAIAMGGGAEALGRSAIAMGELVKARGNNTIAIGSNIEIPAGSERIFSIGTSNNLSAILKTTSSTVLGHQNTITSGTGFILGNNNAINAGGIDAIAIGLDNQSNGNTSVALGHNLRATGQYMVAVGGLNQELSNPVAFVVGNGSNTTRSNAFVVLQDGKTGVGLTNRAPVEMLEVEGSIKVKAASISANGSCTNKGTIAFGSDGNFYGCTGTSTGNGVWKKLNN